MLIALDYDGTYTMDPELWNIFIKTAKERNATVICVTMRYPYEGDEVLNSIGKHCEVIFTSRCAKREFLLSKKISPDIWIDDQPHFIYIDG